VIVQSIVYNSMHTTSQSCAYSVYHIHSISITMVYSQNNMLSHLMNHVHFTYELCNTHNYSIILKIILTRRVPTVDLIIIFVILKGSYNCVIAQFIAHNTIHISIYMYSVIHHMFNSPHTHNLNHHFISSI